MEAANRRMKQVNEKKSEINVSSNKLITETFSTEVNY